jgi:hypothetical protein
VREVDREDRVVWVPETRLTSCDLLILVEQSAEAVVPSDGVRLARRRLGEWSEGSGLAEGPVWPVAVVVVLVLVEHGGGVPSIDDQDGSRSSRRMLPTKRSAIALARGARAGVLIMRKSMAVKTASNAAVNLASRSRMRNRKR